MCDKNHENFYCSTCDYNTCRKSEWDRHLSTRKHKILTTGDKNHEKITEKFYCSTCDYKTCRKSEWDRHLSTRKHKILTDTYKINKNHEKSPNLYTCECGSTYKHRQSLNNHKNICPIINAEVQYDHSPVKPQTTSIDENLIKVLTEAITDAFVKVAGHNTTNNHTNSHNTTNNTNTFNLQFFLNDTCKDAMNISDFVKNLQISTSDFERLGDIGYTEGISRILIDGLNELDVTRRPIHCSDVKREVIHIKDQDKWEKDTPNQDKLKCVIKQISNKNMMVMDNWQQENPGCKEYNNRKNDLYLKLLTESIGPVDSATSEKHMKKIVKNIAMHTIIDKQIKQA